MKNDKSKISIGKFSGEKPFLLALILILILGAALRLYNLDYDSLWLDEAYTVQLSTKSIDEIVYITAMDVHPPLYYILIHFWLSLGNSEWMIRFPSVLFGVLSIYLTYKIARKFYGETEGLISAFLLSLSYTHIFYSKESRMYAMLVFLTLCSIYFFYLGLEDNRKKWWIGYTITAILGIYTHYMMMPVLMAMAIYFLLIYVKLDRKNAKIILSSPEKARYFGLSLIFIIISYIPLISMMAYTLTKKAAGGNIFGIQPNISFFHDVIAWFGMDFQLGGKETIFSLIYIILFALGIYSSIGKYEEKCLFLVVWFFLPVIFGFILASIMHFMPRYVLHALPAYLILIARGIKELPNLIPKVSISPRASKAMSAIFLGCIVIVSYPHLVQLSTQKLKEDWRGCGEFLVANGKASDIIIIEPYGPSLQYYYNNSSMGTVIFEGMNLTMIQETLKENQKIWFIVVTSDIKWSDREGKLQMYIARNTEFKADYNGILIFLKEK